MTLTNSKGAEVTLSSVGAAIVRVVVPDAKGHMDDVVLGYTDPHDYFYDGPCAGKIPGRYASRIARGHSLSTEQNTPWPSTTAPTLSTAVGRISEPRVGLRHRRRLSGVFLSGADGEEGYPAISPQKATYTWSDDCRLTLTLEAETDKPTVVNLTNHASLES